MSSYPMTDVDMALRAVLAQAFQVVESRGSGGGPLRRERVGLRAALGRRLAEDVFASEPFPPFAAAILDGYAVHVAETDARAGVGGAATRELEVVEVVTAGLEPTSEMSSAGATCAYITTGAKMPRGANAVVGIEKTTVLQAADGDAGGLSPPSQRVGTRVQVPTAVAAGASVRPIGKDIAQGAKVLSAGQVLRAPELGILATTGTFEVWVAAKAAVGVLSTGDELVDPAAAAGTTAEAAPTGARIRDVNRTTLLALMTELGAEAVDLGLVRDDKDTLRAALVDAMGRCDVVISSGGVSMGSADHIKPLLEELGTVHFGRLNMKPGKPTTFATCSAADITHQMPSTATRLMFGVPGNPVSCVVTARLLIEPTLRCFAGLPPHKCMHSQVDACLGATLKLDTERPEYHRAVVEWDAIQGRFLATSTGGQISSRLLSLVLAPRRNAAGFNALQPTRLAAPIMALQVGANALLCLPQGETNENGTTIAAGTMVPALLIGELSPPSPTACFHHQCASLHLAAAGTEAKEAKSMMGGDGGRAEAVTEESDGAYVSFSSFPDGASSEAGAVSRPGAEPVRASSMSPLTPRALATSLDAPGAQVLQRRPVCRICVLSVAVTRAKPTSWDDAAIGEAVTEANGASAAVFERLFADGRFGDGQDNMRFPFEWQLMESRVLIDPKEKQVRLEAIYF